MGIVYNLGAAGCKIVTVRPLSVGGMVADRMATVRWRLQFEFGLKVVGMVLKRERLAQYLRDWQPLLRYK